MYCPSCGTEERNRSQFCRTCGAELRAVRTAIEQPDAITASAISAREEIARVIADKISELDSADDLRHATEDILPAVERYLHSPEERRLRNEEKRLELIRGGFIAAIVGLGLVLFFLLVSWVTDTKEVLIASGAGGLVCLIGFAVFASGMLFGVSSEKPALPKKITNPLAKKEIAAAPQQADITPAQHPGAPSVTEGTTRHLKE